MRRALLGTFGWLPSYRVVIAGLVAILAVAIGLGVSGESFVEPLALLASGAVAVGATLGSGWLLALLVGRRFHPESSVTTGLLIILILQPSLTPTALLGVAIAGLVASISKYLLAFRRRHIFNPTAIGALTVGLVGLGFPSWWIGTPWMQPVIILGAAVVLTRTGLLRVGIVFVVVASTIALGAALTAGVTFYDALNFALASSPVFFFAGFMLSEPLTLPPRRWQRVLAAIAAAVVFAVPFSSGTADKYLLGLLVANVIGFAFSQRRSIRLDYMGASRIGERTVEARFQPERPVRFAAGQYLELSLPHGAVDRRGTRRHFSIASAPAAGTISIAFTANEPGSSFKRALLALPPGSTVHATGVNGDFMLPRDAAVPLLLVAGGIGITPFASQLSDITLRGEERDLVVIWAVRDGGALPFQGDLECSGARVIVFAPQRPDGMPEQWEYAGSGRLTADRLDAAVADLRQRHAMVSGPPGFVGDVSQSLRSRAVKRVTTDHFTGY